MPRCVCTAVRLPCWLQAGLGVVVAAALSSTGAGNEQEAGEEEAGARAAAAAWLRAAEAVLRQRLAPAHSNSNAAGAAGPPADPGLRWLVPP